MPLRRWRSPRARNGRYAPRRFSPWSWVEQPFAPALASPNEQSALVQPVGPVTPELDAFRHDAISAPMRRARDVLPLEPRLQFFEPALKDCSSVESARLVRSPSAELRIAGTGREIGIGLSG